jgi:hypothetical protein|tara:strand:- start:209 stop:451 length:243 start_codon:yes stop_codon:yes gene_type:complete
MQEELIESKDGKSNFAGESFLAAAKLHCRAKLAEAEAKIELYLGDSVGIGDHPNIMEEILKAADDGCHAEDMLNFLDSRW